MLLAQLRGGNFTTHGFRASFPTSLLRRLGAALRCQRGVDNHLVMSAMGGMTMPGGWTMSMMWMRMPGLTWPGTAASFLGMWVVMMVAMMLPSLAPMLWRYR